MSMRTEVFLRGYEIGAGSSVLTSTDVAGNKLPLGGFDGYASLQIKVSGSGALTCYVVLSNDGENFVKFGSGSPLFSNFSASSGPDSNGEAIFNVQFGTICSYVGFIFAESGGTSPVTVTATLCIA